MKINNQFFLSMVIIALLGLSGCASYKAKPLKRLSVKRTNYMQNKPVSFAYHVFTKKDCKRYLDRDVISKGYQPIHITITNHSGYEYDFNTKNLSLQTVPAQVVAKEVHTSTVKRAVGYGVVGLFIWPFLIPAVVDGVKSEKANDKLNDDFAYKVLHDQTIPPHGTINGLVFVARDDYTPNFSLTLLNKKNNTKLALLATSNVSA